MPEIDSLALASNGDVFIATGRAAVLAGLRDRAGYFVGVDPPIGHGLGEVPRLAIGMGGMGATFLALRQALVDAIAVRLIGDDENATVGPCHRPREEGKTGQKRWNGSHVAPVNEGVALTR